MSFEDSLCNADWETVPSEFPHLLPCDIQTFVGGVAIYALRSEIRQLCERHGLRYREIMPRNITTRISLEELFK